MAQYYVAIEPPAAEAQRIARAMAALGDPWPIPHVTVISPRGLSLDLSWLPVVRAVAAQSPPFGVAFGGTGLFGDQTLYLAVESAGLARLRSRLIDELGRGPLASSRYFEDRPYVAHLTLARSRGVKGLAPYEAQVAALGDLEEFVAVSLTVFRRAEPAAPYQSWLRLPFAGR